MAGTINRTIFRFTVILYVLFCFISIAAAQADKLESARKMLKGTDKNIDRAQQILLELADNPAGLTPVQQCYVYVYLGYIEDRAGNRQTAANWFKKAVELQAAKQDGIYGIAEDGLSSPVTWIKHLDQGTQNKSTDMLQTIGKGHILKDQPEDIGVPATNLSAAERMENFDILARAIDQYYSFFDHKNINWPEITAAYKQKVEAANTGTKFYRLMYQFIRELKDAHSWLCNFNNVPLLDHYTPPVRTRRIEGKLVVTDVEEKSDAYADGLRPGNVITGIDGMEVNEKIDKIRPFMKMVSSERCFLEKAYRQILCGPKSSNVTIRFITLDGQVKIARLKRIAPYKEIIADPGFPVTKQEYVWHGIHPSGYGYIRITSFNGRYEGADEFDKALEQLKNTPGLILDVRENPGGFGPGQEQIIGRFITARSMVNIAYQKNGPAHNNFTKRQIYFEPTGAWQYTKPVILLTDTITGSASDLFVCRLKSIDTVITMGTPTHGNSTGTCVYVQLPCNLLVRISSGYICDADGNIIEKNGNVPEIHADLTIDDIINGTDSVIERAVLELHHREQPK